LLKFEELSGDHSSLAGKRDYALLLLVWGSGSSSAWLVSAGLNHKMKKYSQRLCLEPLEPYHAKLLFDGLQSASIYDFIEDVPPQSVESLRERYMMLAHRQSPDGTEIWLNWAVWSLVEKCYVGYVQATIPVDNRAILAYVFFPNFWGKGYAREAVTCMINYLVETYQNLDFIAYVDVQNHRSIALLHNLGFVRSTF
jgi:[ribosomal protein S5]-alanine N-acetyltransferase